MLALSRGLRGAWRGCGIGILSKSIRPKVLLQINSRNQRYLSSSSTSAQDDILKFITKTTNTNHASFGLVQQAIEHFQKQNFKEGIEQLNAAVALDYSLELRSNCAILACYYNLHQETINYADPLIAELGERAGLSLLFTAAVAHYDLRHPEKVVELTTQFLRTNSNPEIMQMFPSVYAMRASSLAAMKQHKEAMKDFRTLEQLPTVPMSDILHYPKILDSKWAHLLSLFAEPHEKGELCQRAFDTLFKHTDLSRQPADLRINANRTLIFHNAVLSDRSRIPEAITRLTDEIINNDKVHPFWKSIAIMERKELSNFPPVQQVAEIYGAIMNHRNTFTLLGLSSLTAEALALNPEVDRDKFLLALDEFSRLLFAYRDDPYMGTILAEKNCFWVNLSFLSLMLYDFVRAAQYCELGLHLTKDLDESDKHVLNRIAATSYLLQKRFSECVQFVYMPRVELEHSMILATAYMMLGEEHYDKAWNLLALQNKGEGRAQLATDQMAKLIQQKERISSEELNMAELQQNWRAINLAGSKLIPTQESINHCTTTLGLPVMSKALLSLTRYATHNSRADLYAVAGDYAKAIEDYEVVQREYPAVARYYDMRVCYYELGRFTELLAVLQKLINLTTDPALIDKHLGETAVTYCDMGNPEKAHEALMQFKDKTTMSWYENMVDASKLSGRLEEALEYTNKLMDFPNCDLKLLLVARAPMLLQLGRVEEAKRIYEQVVGDPQRGSTAILGLAKIYEAYLNDNAKALQLYAKVLEQHPVEAHEGSAVCLYNMGLDVLALEQVELSFKHCKPEMKRSTGFLLRGNIYMAMNKTKEALADFTTVISMDADNVAEAYFSRGRLHFMNDNKEEAASDFEVATKMNPDQIPQQIQNFHTYMEMQPK